MDEAKLRALLDSVRSGEASLDDAVAKLRDLPFTDLGYAMVDHHRALRQGAPEVIFGEGKTPQQIIGIARAIVAKGAPCLITRVDPTKAVDVLAAFDPAVTPVRHAELARCITLGTPTLKEGRGKVAVVAAGTSDLPVAEEACETLVALGREPVRLYDVGVAGIHRLLMKREVLTQASVLIVVAGMEGALPSVVGGLTDRPVIGVPTSVGYGAALGGLTPLAAMLTSCASGITVVNIDNGFGAAFAASRIDR